MRNNQQKDSKMKTPKTYKIIETKHYNDRKYEMTGTLEELIEAYSYTLECGRSWQYEKGNKKIDCHPKTIKSLVKNIYNAKNNSARNGYAGVSIDYEVL
jgi:hypothetical protein